MSTIPLWITYIAAFFIAILSGLGLGSAGLFVLYLTIIANFSQAEAQGLNLLFFLFSAGTALLFHARHRVIPRSLVLFLTCCAIPGTLIGTWLLHTLELSLLRKLFGGMLILTALPTRFRKRPASDSDRRTSEAIQKKGKKAG